MEPIQNPVFDGYFADPFVWRHEGVYYAVGTGEHEATGDSADDAASVIPLLRSPNLVDWESLGSALIRPDPALGGSFWAPSVAVGDDGRHYLYYSVGGGHTGHQLRVAVSDGPTGPYRDSGQPLMRPEDAAACPFAIDTDPFRDDDGTWYLFYARDFLDNDDGARAGTALVMDRLESMTRLAGEERTVLRARHDWTLYQANRTMYEQTYDWHTIEGASVVKRGGRYWCLYSGACFGNETYGVDFCVADSVLGPYDDTGAEKGPRILKTVPGSVIGPGHNSIVTGPDGSDYIVYHAWNPEGEKRQMCIDRLVWPPDGPRLER